MSVKRILVIAGSDSSGGAGLEADQKVIAAHGCYAMTATTGLTAQNTQGVYGIHATLPEFVKKQIDACIDDVGVDVVKTGMLTSAATIEIIADAFRRHNVTQSVVDPVMVSTSGAQLLPEDAVKVMCKELLPITTILTPNLPEAKLLLQESNVEFKEPESIGDVIEIAKAVQKLGPKYVLLKGGHLPLTSDGKISKTDEERHSVVNVLHSSNGTVVLENEYQRSKNTHGTGCSLASAIACNLACGMTVAKAVKAADQYVEAGIRTSKDLGLGSGPINHFHSSYKLPFAPGRFVEYLLDREDVQGPWHLYTEHDFVRRMQLGTLPLESFKNYLIQDYLFLIQFSRANALAAYKGKTLEDIKQAATNVLHVQDEVRLHLEYCQEFGLDVENVQNQAESTACTAYTRYVLDLGQSEDFIALQIALLPCLLGYGMIAKRLFNDQETLRDGNKYWKWIETYVADDYGEAMTIGRGLIEKHAVNQSAVRIEELAKIFIHATRMEASFWDIGSEWKSTTLAR